MLELLKKVPEQYEASLELVKDYKIKFRKVNNIVFCGMGASGIVGDIVKDYLYSEIKVPIIVNKNKDIPKFVDKNSLVFVISHSGCSKEALSCYKQAKLRKAFVISITSNKKLKWDNKFLIPNGKFGRVVLYYSLFPILVILGRLKLIKNKDKEINKALRTIKNFKDIRKAEKVARKLYKKMPVVRTSFAYRSVGYYWKTQLNELSKVFVVQNFYPEINHNEIEAIFGYKLEVVELKEKKMDLASILSYMYSADWVGYFLSKMNKVDALKTPVIDRLKK